MNQVFSFAWLALGLALSGYFLGDGLKLFKTGFQRAVTVKGISQKTVEADTLKIEISYWDVNDEDPEKLHVFSAKWENQFIEALKKIGFSKDEILVLPAEIFEQTKTVRDNNRNVVEEKKQLRIDQRIHVVSKNLNLVENVKTHINADSMGDLKYNLSIQYDYADLDSIRPEMIAESLQSAQKAANEFAKASRVKVGKISKAQQGRFTITSPSASGEYDSNERYSKAKKVRVVSNITFDLE